MKHPTLKWFFTIVTVAALQASYAQKTDPKQSAFSLQPQEVIITTSTLQNVINLKSGSPVNINLTNSFVLIGTVASSLQKYDNLKSLIIKLTNYPDMVFNISAITEPNKEIRYVGRIIGSKYTDAYEIEYSNNTYKLKKQITEHLIQTCSH